MEQRSRYFYTQLLQRKDCKINELQQELDDSEANFRSIHGSLQQVQQENAHLREELLQLRTYNDRLEQNGHAPAMRLRTEVATLQRRLRKTEEALELNSECRDQRLHNLEGDLQRTQRRFSSEQEEWRRRGVELESRLREQSEKLARLNEEALAYKTDIRHLQNYCTHYERLLTGDRQWTQRLIQALDRHKKKVQALKTDFQKTKQWVQRSIVRCLKSVQDQVQGQFKQIIVSLARAQLEALARKDRELEACREEGERRVRELQDRIRELARQRRYAVTNSFWLTVH